MDQSATLYNFSHAPMYFVRDALMHGSRTTTLVHLVDTSTG
jgi:hypothetical protein